MHGNVGTKASHTVWKHYLKAFCSGDGRLYVKDIVLGKLYRTTVDNVAKENHIYTIKNQITQLDIDIFKYIFKIKGKGNDDDFLLNLVCYLNNKPELILKDKLFADFIHKEIRRDDDLTFQRNQEKLFTYYEENFLPIYHMLLERNSDFYNPFLAENPDIEFSIVAAVEQKTSMFLLKGIHLQLLKDIGGEPDDIAEVKNKFRIAQYKIDKHFLKQFKFCDERYFNIYYFLTFILSQYFRTQNRIAILNDVAEDFAKMHHCVNYNTQSLAVLFIHFQTQNMAIKLIQSEHKIVFIDNDSAIKFLTSDCPIINTYSSDDNKVELYYPLSPTQAILFTNSKHYNSVNQFTIKTKDVVSFNELIANSGCRRIYSSEPITN